MTLRISDATYNLNQLAGYSRWFSGDQQILTEDAKEMFDQAAENSTGIGYTAKKITHAALATLAVSALTIGPFLGGVIYVALNPTTAFDYITKLFTSSVGTHTSSVVTGAIIAYSSTEDGRDMLKFLTKGTIYAMANLGVKVGQNIWNNYDEAAKKAAENNEKNISCAVEDLTKTYQSIAEELHALPNKEEARQLATSVRHNLPAIENRYRKLGVEERDLNKILRSLKGELERLGV